MASRKSAKGGAIRNAARTRARILLEATKLFARRGFEGTTTAQIVAAADINKRMLFYYFGDKKGLYRAVFVEQWSELKEEMDRAIISKLSASVTLTTKDALVETLGVLFDFMGSHRDLLRLMMWEGLEGGAISRSIWKEVRGPLFLQAVALIEQAQREGFVGEAVEPAHYIVTWLGAVTFYFAYAHTMPDMVGPDPLGRDSVKRRRAQLMAMQERMFEK